MWSRGWICILNTACLVSANRSSCACADHCPQCVAFYGNRSACYSPALFPLTHPLAHAQISVRNAWPSTGTGPPATWCWDSPGRPWRTPRLPPPSTPPSPRGKTVKEIASVADPDPGRIRDPVLFWHRDRGWVKKTRSRSGIRIRDEQPGSFFREFRNHFLWLKYLNSLMRIQDGKIRIRIRNTGYIVIKNGNMDHLGTRMVMGVALLLSPHPFLQVGLWSDILKTTSPFILLCLFRHK